MAKPLDAVESSPRPRRKASESGSASKQIESFLAKYTPQLIAEGKESRSKMRKRVPGGVEFVYDNYNALVFGYGPSERPSEAVLSLALMPRWVTLCFLKGARLSDPQKLLKGTGSTVRNVRLTGPQQLDDPYIERLIGAAIEAASPAFPRDGAEPQTVIKSISAKQRSRRPR